MTEERFAQSVRAAGPKITRDVLADPMLTEANRLAIVQAIHDNPDLFQGSEWEGVLDDLS